MEQETTLDELGQVGAEVVALGRVRRAVQRAFQRAGHVWNLERLERDHGLADVDRIAGSDKELAHAPVARRPHRMFHLHRFDGDDRGTRADDDAGLDWRRYDNTLDIGSQRLQGLFILVVGGELRK